MRDLSLPFPRSTGDPVPALFRFHREQRLARRAAWQSDTDALLAGVMAAIDTDLAARQRAGIPVGMDPVSPEPLPPTVVTDIRHAPHRSIIPTTRTWLLRAASALLACAGGLWAIQLHYADLRAQEVAPVTATFVNAPLSDVMADLRRRYDIDIEACDPGYRRDRVTITVAHAPIDSVLTQIAAQTFRWAHWHGVRTVRLTPYPDPDRGWWYNIRLFARGYFAEVGCRR